MAFAVRLGVVLGVVFAVRLEVGLGVAFAVGLGVAVAAAVTESDSSFFRVSGPTLPSTERPLRRWKI